MTPRTGRYAAEHGGDAREHLDVWRVVALLQAMQGRQADARLTSRSAHAQAAVAAHVSYVASHGLTDVASAPSAQALELGSGLVETGHAWIVSIGSHLEIRGSPGRPPFALPNSVPPNSVPPCRTRTHQTDPDHRRIGARTTGSCIALDTLRVTRVESCHISAPGANATVGQTDRRRQFAAIAIRADGSRVPVRLPDTADVSLLAKLELLGLELLGLITGSRREPGGRRR